MHRYGTDTGSDDHLDRFDGVVRERLRRSVLRVVGSGAPPLRYLLAMVGTPSVAVWPQYVYLRNSEKAWFATKWLIDFWKLPAVALWAFWVLVACWRTGAAVSRHCPMWMVLAGMDLMACFLVPAVWVPYEVLNERYRDPVVLTISVVLFWALIVVMYGLLYKQKKCRV
ncbi:unnamed protein product [Durusdinium trenchii]|uniref:Uncharacterized protein n=1 Tax=Durusdinium trenchii TaxID=1381693 RepID=A0ABP0RVD6_9DINO